MRLRRVARDLPAGDEDLELGRPKPRWPFFALAYRVTALARRVLGRERTLRILLDVAFVARRLALEQADRLWERESAFRMRASSLLDQSSLARWIDPGRSVLDVGCGLGHGARLAVRAGASDVVGIDNNNANLAAARAAQPDGRISFVHGDVTRTLAEQLGGRRFDVALLFHIIEHVDDAVALLRDVRAVASRVIVEVPDVESDPLNAARRALGTSFYADADHVREYSPATLRSQLSAAGWRVHHLDRGRGVLLAVADS